MCFGKHHCLDLNKLDHRKGKEILQTMMCLADSGIFLSHATRVF